LTGLQKATTTLAQAVATAEKSGGGNAIGAGLEETNGKIVYEVSVVKNGVAIARLCPGHPRLCQRPKTWMPGPRPGMTKAT